MPLIRFEILSGDDVQRGLTLDGDVASLGRSEHADVVLDGPGVAREHALVVSGRDAVTARHTGGSGPTIVIHGDERTVLDEPGMRAALVDGDLIALGDGETAPRVRVRLQDDPEPEHVLELRGLPELGAAKVPEDRREALLGALRAMERLVGESPALADVVAGVADAALSIVPRATHATVILQDPPDDDDAGFVPVVTRTRAPDGTLRSPPGPVRVTRAVFRKVVREKAAVVAADAVGSELSSESLLGAGIMSTIGVPLWNGARVVGALQLDSRDAPAMFDGADVDALGVLAVSATLAIQNARLIARLEAAEEALATENRYLRRRDREQRGLGGIVGESPGIKQLLAQVQKVAATRVAVLIQGETGTGKELIASAVHQASARSSELFVAQNCAALPEQLLESELFGHRRGAFTGATEEKKGLFEIANHGTLFLDEVGEMPLPLQAKLLRVLQEGELRPVGASHPKRVDVRIVSATNRDLEKEVAAGRFREDLFYRLAVFPLHVPALRDRTGDIKLLAAALLDKHQRELGKTVGGLTQQALDILVAYDWPGNVRELENEIQRVVIQADPDALITPDLLSPRIKRLDRLVSAASAGEGSLKEMMDQVERHLLVRTLDAHGGNKTSAAKALGITREGLHKKLKNLGIA